MPSPFREEHDHFRNTVRQFAQKELAPFADGTYQPSWSRSRADPEKSRSIRRVRLSSESSRLSPMTK